MLNLGDVLQQCTIGQLQVGVLESALRKQILDAFLGLARIDAVADGLRRRRRLPFEAVDYGLHRRCLISLRLKFKFHSIPFNLSAFCGACVRHKNHCGV